MTYDYDVMGFYARVTLVTHSISKRKREEYYIKGRNGHVFTFLTQPSKFLPRYYFQYKQDIFLIHARYSTSSIKVSGIRSIRWGRIEHAANTILNGVSDR